MHPGHFSFNCGSRKRIRYDSVLWIFCLIGIGLGGILFFACGSGKDKQDQAAQQEVSEEQIVAEGIEILRKGTLVERDSVTRTFYNVRNASLLVSYLNDPDPNVQIAVVSALGYIKDKTAVQPLNELLLAVEDYLLRETIIYALGEIRDTSSVSLLIGLLEDDTVDHDLRLSLPITLAAFAETSAVGQVENTFVKLLEEFSDDIELCSYAAMGIQEIVNPHNYKRFHKYIPALREMAKKRKDEFGEDLLWSNFDMAIEKLESYELPAS